MTANAESFIAKVIELTNVERVKAGLAPLRRQDSLCKAAYWMADDMAVHNYFQHQDRLGRSIDTRLPAFGYGDYSAIGENIAAGQLTPTAVVADWMKSPGHRANLLSPDFREIGVSYVHMPNSESHDYWVQDFGSREMVFPVVINLEKPQTASPDVSLYIHGERWAQKMRFSKDGVHWTDWEPFHSAHDWRLDPMIGKQTIYVELNDGKNTCRASSSIELVVSVSPAPASKSISH